MSTRLWTATLVRSYGGVLLKEGTYSSDTDVARHDIEAENPGWRVASLIPGSHTSGGYAFGSNKVRSQQQGVDVWSHGEFYGHGRPPNCS